GVRRAANFTIAMLLDTRIASARVSVGWGSSSVIVRPGRRYVPSSPETCSPGRTRLSDSSAAAAKIFATDPGSNVSMNALRRAVPVLGDPADGRARQLRRRVEAVHDRLEVDAAHAAQRLHLGRAERSREVRIALAQRLLPGSGGEPELASDHGAVAAGIAQL